ncbi:uncharacterized protein LAJ45_06694 [Morchella importuna]|uniref:uncharacterized protein n=1 Tax=Morchella importuna TaxID=1174673 RepID=UPI001E8DD8FE|nr:uncharacterized protein LAJ45_06694 [Morchella importuna]KAH8149155.1 hypothetical protein LAJ45_06694 [Morchella importuna]
MMASRAVPRARLPLLLRPPTARPLSFLQPHTRRPRLPHLLRRHAPPQTTPLPRPTLHNTGHHPRLISAKTREYLLRESLIAARIVVVGYTAIFVTTVLAFTGALLYVESTSPTAPSLPRTARFGITFARVLQRFAPSQTWLAIEVLRDTVQRMPPWDGQSAQWCRGYISAMKLLAELLEEEDQHAEAREWYQRILDTPRERDDDAEWADLKVAAALRVSRIAAFMGDMEGAERALVRGVECTVPLGEEDGGVFPASSVEGLKASTELGVFYARCEREPEALEIFTRVLAARRRVLPPVDPADSKAAEVVSDPCAEAVTMAYIGEVMFSMGDRQQGVAWSKEAYDRSEPLAQLRGKCKECALVAAKNISAMIKLMEEGQNEQKEKKSSWRLFSGASKAEEKENLGEWENRVLRLESIRATKGA